MDGPEDDDDSNCFFDFSLIEQIPVPGGELPSLESDPHWPSNPFPESTNLGTRFVDSSFRNSNRSKDQASRKRTNYGSISDADSKACREKRRRDKLNERFHELKEILDPGKSTKMDKTVVLGDAIRRVTKLRHEAVELKESFQDLQAKVDDLKAEKNELRDEKLKLKAEKERLEQQLKASNAPPIWTRAHSMVPFPFSSLGSSLGPSPGPGPGNKFMPFMGYHGVPMWPFTPPDTSEDHVLRSPLA